MWPSCMNKSEQQMALAGGEQQDGGHLPLVQPGGAGQDTVARHQAETALHRHTLLGTTQF